MDHEPSGTDIYGDGRSIRSKTDCARDGLQRVELIPQGSLRQHSRFC